MVNATRMGDARTRGRGGHRFLASGTGRIHVKADSYEIPVGDAFAFDLDLLGNNRTYDVFFCVFHQLSWAAAAKAGEQGARRRGVRLPS